MDDDLPHLCGCKVTRQDKNFEDDPKYILEIFANKGATSHSEPLKLSGDSRFLGDADALSKIAKEILSNIEPTEDAFFPPQAVADTFRLCLSLLPQPELRTLYIGLLQRLDPDEDEAGGRYPGYPEDPQTRRLCATLLHAFPKNFSP